MPDPTRIHSAEVDTLTVVRALGISCVVINHAHNGHEFMLSGGMAVLLIVSGINMASFAFNGTTRETLKAFKAFTLRLVIPSLVIAILWNLYEIAATTGGGVGINWSELLLFSNWITPLRMSLFPIWYVQVIFQIMLFLALIFWLFDLTPMIRKAPGKATLLALVPGLVIAMLSYNFWDTDYLMNKLPHLQLWLFILGWVFWAYAVRNTKSTRNKVGLSLLLIACEVLMFEYYGAFEGDTRIIVVTACGLLLIWFDAIVLPAFIARPILLVSQATFYVFLFHYYAFWLVAGVGERVGLDDVASRPEVRVAVGLILPVILWMLVTAFRRAHRKITHRAPGSESSGIAMACN